jgi:enoyl-CoA hydratase/carnithine racemase
MPYDTLIVTGSADGADESFAIVTLNRPPANAISEQLMHDLNDALSSLESDDRIRSIILTGSGDRIFCAGADLGSAFSGGDVATFIRFGNSVLRRIERFPKPVIAAMNGHALGGGCEIAMACHFRLLKETARMGQTESNLGIIPGYGGSQRLPRLIGRTKALEYLILGTQIPAAECLALGLVNRLSKEGETLDDAKTLARQLAKRPPLATRLLIEAVDDGLEAPIDKALEIETRAFMKTLRTEDAAEGIQAFFAKREPEFKGR